MHIKLLNSVKLKRLKVASHRIFNEATINISRISWRDLKCFQTHSFQDFILPKIYLL